MRKLLRNVFMVVVFLASASASARADWDWEGFMTAYGKASDAELGYVFNYGTVQGELDHLDEFIDLVWESYPSWEWQKRYDWVYYTDFAEYYIAAGYDLLVGACLDNDPKISDAKYYAEKLAVAALISQDELDWKAAIEACQEWQYQVSLGDLMLLYAESDRDGAAFFIFDQFMKFWP